MRELLNTPEYISQSITVSTKTEAMLIKIGGMYHFIEYPTNMPPNPSKLLKRGNYISNVTEEDFTILIECFEKYTLLKQENPFLHAPSFMYGWCYSKGFNLKDNKILV